MFVDKNDSKWQSMAARKHQIVAEDVARSRREIEDKLVERGAIKSLAGFRASSASLAAKEIENPLFTAMQFINEQLDEDLASLGLDSSLGKNVILAPLDMSSVSATHEFLSDGSGLVHISNGLLLTIRILAQLTAVVLTAARSVEFQYAAKVDGPEVAGPILMEGCEVGIETVAALLRYQVIQQRVWGRGGTIGYSDAAGDMNTVDWLTYHAYKFVAAHEFSHHVLQHRKCSVVRSFGSEFDQRAEVDADDLAFRLIFTRDSHGRTIPSLGALVAMMAIYFSDHGLILRRGQTHPPTTERVGSLMEHAGALNRDLLVWIEDVLGRSISLAVALESPLPERCWSRVFTNPMVSTEIVGRDYIVNVTKLDLVMTLGELEVKELMHGMKVEGRIDLLSGFRTLTEGGVEPALREWGVKERSIRSICHAQTSLSFYTVVKAIKGGSVVGGIQPILGEADCSPDDLEIRKNMCSVAAASAVWRRLATPVPSWSIR